MGRLSGDGSGGQALPGGGGRLNRVSSAPRASNSMLEEYGKFRQEEDFIEEVNRIAQGKSKLNYNEQIKRINEANKKGYLKREDQIALINQTVDRNFAPTNPLNAFETGFKAFGDAIIQAPKTLIEQGRIAVESGQTPFGKNAGGALVDDRFVSSQIDYIQSEVGKKITQQEADRLINNLRAKSVSAKSDLRKAEENVGAKSDQTRGVAALGTIGLDFAGGALIKGAGATLAGVRAATTTGGRLKAVGTPIAQSAALGATYGATAPIVERGADASGSDIATGAAVGGALGAALPGVGIGASSLNRAVRNADTKLGGAIANFGERVGQSKAGQKFTAAKDAVSQKLINNLQYVQKPFKGKVDSTTGRQVVEEIRELATNVRQSAGLAAERRRNNQAWQSLASEFGGRGKTNQIKELGAFISKKQNAINASRTTGEAIDVPVGTPAQERAYQLLNQATKDDVQYAFDNGLLTPEQYDNFINDTNYTRVQKNMEDVLSVRGQGGAEASISTTVFGQKLKGSQRENVDPFVAYTDWSNRITEQVERNKFANYLTDQLLEEKLADVAEVGATNTLARFREGIKELIETDPQIVESIKNMDKVDFGALQKYVTFPSRLLQAGATGSNIAFAVPNFVRDQINSYVVSKNGLATHNPLAILEGIKEGILKPSVNALARGARLAGRNEQVWKPSPMYQEFLSRNANMTRADLVRELKGATRTAYEELGLKGESGLRKLENIVSATEKAGRYQNFIGTYRNALKKNPDNPELALKQAQQAARENAVDFSQRGEFSTFARLFNPYFNASVQGSRTLARAFKERPLGTAAKVATTVLIPIAGSTYYNLSDPQRAYVYARIPEYTREANLIFVLSDGSYIKLPLPPGVKEFGQPVREAIEAEYLGDPPTFLDTAKQLLIAPFSPVGTEPNQLMSSLVPQAIRPAVENAANYSFFRDSPIVGANLQTEAVDQQVYEKTPQTYRDIGAVLGISPLAAQNLVTGYGAGGAEQLVAALDNARRAAGFDVRGSDRDTASQIKKRFFADKPSDTSNAVTTRFYEEYLPLRNQQTSTSRKITSLIKQDKLEEARILANKHNEKIDGQKETFVKTYGRYEPESALLTELNNLKINLTDRSIKSRRSQD